jgi:hypothetical protein
MVFPRTQRSLRFPKAAQALAAPEFFRIDPVAAFDLAVLLRARRLDVAILEPGPFHPRVKARENSLPLSVCNGASKTGRRPGLPGTTRCCCGG